MSGRGDGYLPRGRVTVYFKTKGVSRAHLHPLQFGIPLEVVYSPSNGLRAGE